MSAEPKAHGLLLRGAMVRARFRGEKTSTMRPVAPHNTLVNGSAPVKGDKPEVLGAWCNLDFTRAWVDPGPSPAGNAGPYLQVPGGDGSVHRVYPRIQPGDLIWFKETWMVSARPCPRRGFEDGVIYRSDLPHKADGSRPLYPTGDRDTSKYESNSWKSSIHMPRWAARDTTTVLEVVPKRPCDLTEEEERAEGFPLPLNDPDAPGANFADFIQDLHGGPEVMGQWMWLYRIARFADG